MCSIVYLIDSSGFKRLFITDVRQTMMHDRYKDAHTYNILIHYGTLQMFNMYTLNHPFLLTQHTTQR